MKTDISEISATPKTIRDAITIAMKEYTGVPVTMSLIDHLEDRIRDVFAQKFSVLILGDNPHIVDASETLWNQLFSSEFKMWTERPREDEGV